MAKTGASLPLRIGVDVVPLTPGSSDLMVYLRKGTNAPFEGRLRLPGDLLRGGERTEEAAERIVADVGGIHNAHLTQLYTFSDPDRDPHAHTVGVAYTALFPTSAQRENPHPLEDAWMPLREALNRPLAYDHARILRTALRRLQGRLDYTDDAYHLLARRFTIPQLQRIHELVQGQPLKADVFTKRVLRSGLRRYRTRETVPSPTGGRPAYLYRNPAQEVPA